MAENILYSIPESRDASQEEDLLGELKTEIEEVDISEYNRNLSRSKCEMCVIKKPLTESVAVSLCFVCEMYVCVKCVPGHSSHEGMRVGRKESLSRTDNEESEGEKDNEESDSGKDNAGSENDSINKKGKKSGKEIEGTQREDQSGGENRREESDRMEKTCEEKRTGEQAETERERNNVLDDLFNESEMERKEKFDKNHVNIYDRVKVKHELDKEDCRITGLCGLDKRWVVCDYLNSCIKLFTLGSNILQRYIRFVSQPWDVTEINLTQKPTEPNLVSGSSSDISVTDRGEADKQCLIAVTLLGKRQIMFIDLGQKPALTQKRISTEERCYSIEFYDDKIFTVCRKEDSPAHWSVYIKSTDGDTLYKFDTEIYLYFGPRLAVMSGKVYLTDYLNNRIQCRNFEGHVISKMAIKGSDPVGISVDLANNVYVCAWGLNEVYKLDPNLTRYSSVLDQTTNYIERCHALCYYKDKLFVSHHWLSSLENFVTVVRLL